MLLINKKEYNYKRTLNRTTCRNFFDSRTKEYFSEVLSSYMAGNYRSATVMHWSVIICDLLFKLEKLSEIYEDKDAQNLINNIKNRIEDINNKVVV